MRSGVCSYCISGEDVIPSLDVSELVPDSTTNGLPKNSPLNKDQIEAATTDDKSRLVVALAGSGKSKLLIERIVHLILHKGETPENIMMLTFTVKAADEIKNRLKKRIGDIAKKVTCSTFHSWSFRLLKKYYKVLGIDKNPKHLDDIDSIELWKSCAELLDKPNKKAVAKAYHLYSFMRNKNIALDKALELKGYSPEEDDLANLLTTISSEYEKRKQKYNYFDYDDYIDVIEHSLKINKSFRRNIASGLSHILLDEVQDCNSIQVSIIQSLLRGSLENNSKSPLSIFACGDENQSIYGFRGADFKNMKKFPQKFKSNVSLLTTNYRSTQEILDFANAIGKNLTMTKWNKPMKGVYHGEKPLYIRMPDRDVQLDFVVDTVSNMIKRKGFSGKEIAILYRGGSDGDKLEALFTKKQLVVERRGGLSIFKRSEIRDVLAFLRAVFLKRDVISWTRLIKTQKGVGEKKAKNIVEYLIKKSDMIKSMISDLYPDKEKVLELAKVMKQVSTLNDTPEKALKIAISFLSPIHDNKRDPDRYQRLISGPFSVLMQMAKNMSTVKKFLETINLNPNSLKRAVKDDILKEQGGRIVVSTIHGIKGAEFNTVFIVSCSEPFLPSQVLMHDGGAMEGVDWEIKPDYSLDDPEKVEEERRLFYVACTRARHNLIVVSPMTNTEYRDFQTSGQVDAHHSYESRFIHEIPNLEDLVKVIYPNRVEKSCTSFYDEDEYEDYY